MKVTTVEYSKVINLGNYENEKIGLVVELEENETPSDALIRCRNYVKALSPRNKPSEFNYQEAKELVLRTDDFTPKKIKEFQDTIDRYELSTFEF